MKPDTKSTAAQMFILRGAVRRRPQGEIEPLPDNLYGRARVKVMTTLL